MYVGKSCVKIKTVDIYFIDSLVSAYTYLLERLNGKI